MIPTPDRKKINAELEKMQKVQKGQIVTLGDETALQIDRWSTGIEDLDKIIGGGMPYGRIVEIFGAESSGKTTLMHHLTSLHEIALNIPAEGTFDAERAKLFGNTSENLHIYRSQIGEDAMNMMCKCAKMGYPLVVLDTVAAIRPKEELTKLEANVDKNRNDAQKVGGAAGVLARYIPHLNMYCESTGTTAILVNQVRDKFDAGMFGEKTKAFGGHIIPHYASIRLQTYRRGNITIPNYDKSLAHKEEVIGIYIKIKVVKSKICNPNGVCEIPYFYERGFVSWADADDVRAQIMLEHKEKYSKRKVKSRSDERWEEEWSD